MARRAAISKIGLGIRRIESIVGLETALWRKTAEGRAVVGAARWLKSHHADLEGDDSVGWWLLIFSGERVPYDTEQRFLSQQRRLLSAGGISGASLYTLTAISRTLARNGVCDDTPAVLAELRRCIESELKAGHRTLSRDGPRDLVWAVQALYELGGLKQPAVCRWIKEVLHRLEISDVVSYAMLYVVIRECLGQEAVRAFDARWRRELQRTLRPHILNTFLDWEVSYLLLFSLYEEGTTTSRTIADYLIGRQTDQQWDEAFDENIESTSLVGLALAAYASTALRAEYSCAVTTKVDQMFSLMVADGLHRKDVPAELWEELNLIEDSDKKGRALERFVRSYCDGDRDLRVESVNLRTRTEEIDLVLENLAESQFYKDLRSRFILVECKYRRKRTSASMVRDFCSKVRNRKPGLWRVGAIVSVAGYSSEADQELFRANTLDKDLFFAAIDGTAIGRAVRQRRSLGAVIEEAVLASGKQ